jgi:carboxymethylenebutenolidase
MSTGSETIALHVGDGSTMNAYVARPTGSGVHPGIIVGQEAFGVNSHIRSICERLANAGYFAIAPELYHRTAPTGATFGYNEFDIARPHAFGVTVEGAAADLRATYDYLLSDESVKKDSIGAIGFCMGGRMAFIANLELPLKAAVSFYGGGIPALLPRTSELHAPHLFVWAGLDKNITHEIREQVALAMTAAGKEFTSVVVSNAEHGFNCDERAAYNPAAANEAWAMTLAFLANRLPCDS